MRVIVASLVPRALGSSRQVTQSLLLLSFLFCHCGNKSDFFSLLPNKECRDMPEAEYFIIFYFVNYRFEYFLGNTFIL